MAVPTFDQFILPLLKLLGQLDAPIKAADAYHLVAGQMGLSEADREELLPSGSQETYKNRIGWAYDRLKRAGLAKSQKRGYWAIDTRGREFLSLHGDSVSAEVLYGLAFPWRSNTSAEASADNQESSGREEILLVSSTPEERLDAALLEIRSAVVRELLEALGNVTPTHFESIVLEVLLKMGYGATRNDLQRVGGSGDGGIDGIISLDKLGLEKVYVQAKRWTTGPVGRPEIQAFYGALAGVRARKGVFITTSHFKSTAVEFARSVEGIVLVDGDRLANLMIDHGVGVTLRAIHIPRIDGDWFEQS